MPGPTLHGKPIVFVEQPYRLPKVTLGDWDQLSMNPAVDAMLQAVRVGAMSMDQLMEELGFEIPATFKHLKAMSKDSDV